MSLTERFNEWYQLLMPNRAFILCFSFAAGMALSGTLDPLKLVFGMMTLLCAYCSAAVFNNICDVESDRINDPSRPLARGLISLRAAWLTMFALIGAGLFFGTFVSVMMVAINIVYVGFGTVYSLVSKSRWFLSYATLVTSHMITPLTIGYLVFGSVDQKILTVLAFVFITEVLAFSLKDYKDVEGDRSVGMNTLPIAFRLEDATRITALGLVLPLILVWLPWSYLKLSPVFLGGYLIAGVIRTGFAVRLMGDPTPTSAGIILKKFRYVLLLQMICWCLS
jgi:geranylgeranylglycerol-phosphate geranylgeranyltransferase